MSLAAHRWYFVLKNDIRVEAYTDAYQADVPSGSRILPQMGWSSCPFFSF